MSKDVVKKEASAIDLTAQDEIVFFEGYKTLEFSVEGVPAWHKRVSAGEGWFQSSVDLAELDKKSAAVKGTHESYISLVAAPSIAAGVAVPYFLGLPITGEPSLGVFLMYGSALITGFGVISLPPIRKFFRASKRFNSGIQSFTNLNRKGLETWLKARYNLTVSDKTISYLYAQMNGKAVQARFQDVTGASWFFAKAEDGTGWFVEPVEFTSKREASKTVVKESSLPVLVVVDATESLPETIREQVQKISITLSKLGPQADVELTHTISRISSDMDQAIKSYQQLIALGGQEQGEAALLKVLGFLQDEASMLVQKQIDVVVTGLNEQGEYLKSRNLWSGSTKSLPLPDSTTNIVPVSDE